MQIKVIKVDGSIEQYIHTKVMGAVSNALAQTGHPDVLVAENLAEVVTYFLYHKKKTRVITSGEILSIIKAVLTSTGYEDAAIALTEYNFQRRLKRSRIEVVSIHMQDITDAHMLCQDQNAPQTSQWDKSIIVKDLLEKYDLAHQAARTIASMVEEKIFNMGLTVVPASLIKQLVLGDTAAVMKAHQQLQTA